MPLQQGAQPAQGDAQQKPQGGKQRADLPPEIAGQAGIVPHLPVPVKGQAAQQLAPGDEGAAPEAQPQPGAAPADHFVERAREQTWKQGCRTILVNTASTVPPHRAMLGWVRPRQRVSRAQ